LDGDVKEKLTPILGTPPDLFKPPQGCPFAARCPYTMKVCKQYDPQPTPVAEEHAVKCWLYHELAADVTNPITGKTVKA
jgi:oligopeptide transport system ATP-binding protein